MKFFLNIVEKVALIFYLCVFVLFSIVLVLPRINYVFLLFNILNFSLIFFSILIFTYKGKHALSSFAGGVSQISKVIFHAWMVLFIFTIIATYLSSPDINILFGLRRVGLEFGYQFVFLLVLTIFYLVPVSIIVFVPEIFYKLFKRDKIIK